MNVLLAGYYGKANFGDDVLFKVAYRQLKNWQPAAQFSVLCDQYHEDYLPCLTEEKLGIVQSGEHACFDLIVHGGGGVFFDFGHYGIVDRIVNRLIRSVGFNNYLALDRLARNLAGKQRLEAKRRLGWGIGVGTYSSGSKKLRSNLATLLDFDRMIVRDTRSVENLRTLGITKGVVLGSDLAFLSSHWVPSRVQSSPVVAGIRPRLGLILRDWQINLSIDYLRIFEKMLPELSRRYELTLFVFDKRVDNEFSKIAETYNTFIWEPPVSDFTEFCQNLARQDVIVSSRAHGGICGAVLGVPSVLIEVESKLRTVHDMLPGSTTLLSPHKLDFASLAHAVDRMLECERSVITGDVARNRSLIENAVNSTLRNDD